MKSLRLFSILLIILAFGWAATKLTFSSKPETSTLHQDKVVLYATAWCGYCAKTRAFFKENNIDYIEYDIEKSTEGRAQYQSLNGRGVPLVIVKGKLIRGYNPGLMQSLLDS
jgi:mycoredoxin